MILLMLLITGLYVVVSVFIQIFIWMNHRRNMSNIERKMKR